VEFQLLGPFRVLDDDGHELQLGGPKQRSVLAILVLAAGRAVSADRLIDAIWGEHAPHGALASLHVYISTLRRILRSGTDEQMLIRHGQGYELRLDPGQIDAQRFQRLVAEGRSKLHEGRHADAASLLNAALALWRGPPLSDLEVENLDGHDVAGLEEQRLSALEDRVEADLACGQTGELVAELSALVADHPLRERLWAHLMLALYRSGRQADALRAYARARATLVEEFGIDPGPALRSLEELVLRQDPSLAGARPAGLALQQVPVPTTVMIGREHELASVGRLLAGGARIVTLTGTGGIGKTRLALAVAATLAAAGPRAVYFVPLAAITDPALVLTAVGQVLGVYESPGEMLTTTIAAALAHRPTLLVLDNFEQVLAAGSDVARLLSTASELAVLCTSRTPLHVSGEQQLPVPPLPLPASATASDVGQSGAVALFVARAQAIAPDFELTADTAPTVAAICARLDGLPLALELAAARTKILSPRALLDRLAEPLSMLVGGPQDTPTRHQTLRATLDWSWALLREDERLLLCWLAAFAGGFTVEGVMAESRHRHASASIDVFHVLAGLVDHGLVRPVDQVGELRFELLETVRQYAGEQLRASGDEDAVRSQHAAYVLRSAMEAAPDLLGALAGRRLTELTAALPDIRAAMQWALDHGDAAAAIGVATGLVRLWRGQGLLREGRQWLDAALDQSGLPADAVLDAQIAAGSLAYSMDDYDDASAYLRAVISDSGARADEPRLATAMAWLASVHLSRSELAPATEAGERAMVIARRSGDGEALHRALYSSAHVAYVRGDPLTARALTEEDLALSRGRGDLIGVLSCLTNLATLAVDEQRLDEAGDAVEEALRLAAGLGHAMVERDLLLVRGRVAVGRKDGARARESFGLALQRSRDMGQRYEVVSSIRGLAAAASLDGDHADAAVLFAAAGQIASDLGIAEQTPELDVQQLDHIRERLGPQAYQRAHDKGRRMTRDDVLSLALRRVPAGPTSDS